MILEIFSVYDRTSVQFGNPMFLINKGHAIRSVSDEVNRKSDGREQNMLNAHPEDFDLFSLGTFDTATGLFGSTQPVAVVRLQDLVKRGGE